MQPVKTVNGLNSNIGDMNVAAQHRFTNCFTNDLGKRLISFMKVLFGFFIAFCTNMCFLVVLDLLLARRNALLKQQRLIALREEAANCEIRLPQEWTY